MPDLRKHTTCVTKIVCLSFGSREEARNNPERFEDCICEYCVLCIYNS